MDEFVFMAFWRAYPRKEHKVAAEKAWRKLNPSTTVVKLLMADLARFDGVDLRFVPHPASYLNGKRWTDVRPAPAAPSNGAAHLKQAAEKAARLTPEEIAENKATVQRMIRELSERHRMLKAAGR